MRIARIAHDGGTDHAVAEDDGWRLVDDVFAEELRRLDRWVPATGARLLAPVQPLTVVGMAHNTGPDDRLRPPQAFLKPARSVIGPGDPIPLPSGRGRVDAEAELAVVLARDLVDATPDQALRAVLGYTVANDVTWRDLQAADPLWTRAKGGRGATPLGPWIETDLDITCARMGLAVDGQPRRTAGTDDLARGVAEVLAYLSGFLPLGPGDVVLTGAPGECAPIVPGQHVTARVAGIGELSNPVVAAAVERGAA